MAACEACWAEAFVRARTLGGSQVERYREILAENEAAGAPCAPPEALLVAGCPVCGFDFAALGLSYCTVCAGTKALLGMRAPGESSSTVRTSHG